MNVIFRTPQGEMRRIDATEQQASSVLLTDPLGRNPRTGSVLSVRIQIAGTGNHWGGLEGISTAVIIDIHSSACS